MPTRISCVISSSVTNTFVIHDPSFEFEPKNSTDKRAKGGEGFISPRAFKFPLQLAYNMFYIGQIAIICLYDINNNLR
jgi:hypothetical protein